MKNRIFPIEAIQKHKQAVCMRGKLSFTRWRHILNQHLIKYDEKRYLGQFVSEMFDSLQQDSAKGAPQ